MGILEIKKYPEKILLTRSVPIQDVTATEQRLFEDMLLTMHHGQGIGLAAPQIGIGRRIIVVDLGEGPLKLANPQILQVKTKKDKMQEGCLSVPDAQVTIARPCEIVIGALNEEGKTIELKASGLLARVILHEIDHLNGKLIIEHMNFLEKIRYKWSSKANNGRG